MQLLHHDFYSNFTASIKSGDLTLSLDIFKNELSDFIVFDTEKIISAINKAGGDKINLKNADEEIVDFVIEQLKQNEKLQKTIAFIIADGNELINQSKSNKEKDIEIVNKISNGISRISTQLESDLKGFKDSIMNQIVSKAAQRKEYKRTIWKKDKKGFGIGGVMALSVLMVGVIIVIVYFRQKKQMQNELPNMIMGNGGNIDLSQPNMPPINTMPLANPTIPNNEVPTNINISTINNQPI